MLPDLAFYRSQFVAAGLVLPLPIIKSESQGLLKLLPTTQKKGWPWDCQTSPSIYDAGMSWPKITIVTPSYNQGKFLEQTIRSVLLQNYPNLEYIIIDGGSDDETSEILEKYSHWISYSQQEKDGGQGNAINIGFSMGSGLINSWINSDDYYLPETFFMVSQKLNRADIDFVYGYVHEYLVKESRMKKLNKTIPISDYTLRMPTLSQPSCFWKANIHQPIWEDLSCALDYELWLRLIKGKKRVLLRTPLAVANIHQDAKTNHPSMKEAWQRDHLMICSEGAHGSVKNWNSVLLVHRIRVKFFKLMDWIFNRW